MGEFVQNNWFGSPCSFSSSGCMPREWGVAGTEDTVTRTKKKREEGGAHQH